MKIQIRKHNMGATLAYFDPDKIEELTRLGWLVLITGDKPTT